MEQDRHMVWAAFDRATGPRKYLVLGCALAVAALYEGVKAYGASRGLMLPDIPTWQIVIGVILALFVIWFFQRILKLERAAQPRLKFIYKNEKPFVRVISAPNRIQRIFSIGIENTSRSSAVHKVSVRINKLEGDPLFHWPQKFLDQKDIPPGKIEYWQVADSDAAKDGEVPHIRLNVLQQGSDAHLTPKDHKLEIEVAGEESAAICEHFYLGVDESNRLQFCKWGDEAAINRPFDAIERGIERDKQLLGE